MIVSLLLAATSAMLSTLATLRTDGVPTVEPGSDPFTEFTNTVGLPAVLEAQHRFSDGSTAGD